MDEPIKKTPYVAEEQDVEAEIVQRVANLLPDIPISKLSRWLTERNWDKVMAWTHHPTIEDKAVALAALARTDIKKPIARAGQ